MSTDQSVLIFSLNAFYRNSQRYNSSILQSPNSKIIFETNMSPNTVSSDSEATSTGLRQRLGKTSFSSSVTLPFPFPRGADAAGAPPPLRWFAGVGVDQPVHPLPCGVNITPSCCPQSLHSSSKNQDASPSLQLRTTRKRTGYQTKLPHQNPNYQENLAKKP
jgi:hypothetical protein